MLSCPDSPALNAGDADFRSPPAFDQRGAPFSRVFGEVIDIGAVEYIDGDFNADGIYDCSDLDTLVAAIAAGTNNQAYDMNSDLLVNQNDLDTWLAVAGVANLPHHQPYLAGDGNLDGFVDVADFTIWNENKFTSNPAWCRGDFNADGLVDVSDFNLWSENKYRDQARTGAVPIPVYNFFVPAFEFFSFASRSRPTSDSILRALAGVMRRFAPHFNRTIGIGY